MAKTKVVRETAKRRRSEAKVNVMHLGENIGNLSETKKCFFFPTLSQNEKGFPRYEKRFFHNE